MFLLFLRNSKKFFFKLLNAQIVSLFSYSIIRISSDASFAAVLVHYFCAVWFKTFDVPTPVSSGVVLY